MGDVILKDVIVKQAQSLDFCFEDEYLFVVNKPSGVLSQPGKYVDGSIATLARDFFPDATGPMLVHRLDMDTSGLLLLAKTRSVHRHLQQQFEQRLVSKSYIAILSRQPEAMGGIIRLPLRLDIDNRPTQIVCHEHGKHALSVWRRQVDCTVTRVVFTPVTGRTHQLRVHAAHADGLNAPIVGDRLYGADAERLKLHATRIVFTHPITNQRLTVESAAPF